MGVRLLMAPRAHIPAYDTAALVIHGSDSLYTSAAGLSGDIGFCTGKAASPNHADHIKYPVPGHRDDQKREKHDHAMGPGNPHTAE